MVRSIAPTRQPEAQQKTFNNMSLLLGFKNGHHLHGKQQDMSASSSLTSGQQKSIRESRNIGIIIETFIELHQVILLYGGFEQAADISDC